MQIQINHADVSHSDALDTHVREQVEHATGRFADRLTRVEVHLRDENSPHKGGGDDMHAMFEARPAGRDPIAVEASGRDIYAAIRGAGEKLERALAKRLDPHS